MRLLPPPYVRLRCSACGSKLLSRRTGRAWWAEQAVWQALAWLAVWRLNPSLMWGIVAVFALTLPFGVACDRLWESYWLWRHPLRCGEGHATRGLNGDVAAQGRA